MVLAIIERIVSTPGCHLKVRHHLDFFHGLQRARFVVMRSRNSVTSQFDFAIRYRTDDMEYEHSFLRSTRTTKHELMQRQELTRPCNKL